MSSIECFCTSDRADCVAYLKGGLEFWRSSCFYFLPRKVLLLLFLALNSRLENILVPTRLKSRFIVPEKIVNWRSVTYAISICVYCICYGKYAKSVIMHNSRLFCIITDSTVNMHNDRSFCIFPTFAGIMHTDRSLCKLTGYFAKCLVILAGKRTTHKTAAKTG